MRFKFLKIFFILSLVLPTALSHAQLQVTSALGQSPDNLVKNILIGQGVTVSNVKFNNSSGNITVDAIGEFQNGNTTNIGLNGGLLLTSGSASIAVGPNTQTGAGQANNLPGDPQLQLLIPGYTVNDASVLEFDFVPESDTVEFNWVFGSDEYPEFVNTSFNDVFGFFISGIDPATWLPYNNKNIALIPSPPAPPNTPVTIDNVNDNTYSQYYVNNAGGATIEYDGFTTVLTARAAVIPCLTYHIKIAVADAGDMIYDSGVFLEENSFNSGGITVTQGYVSHGTGVSASNYAIEGCVDALITFKFPAPLQDSLVINIASIGGSATNGTDYTWIPNAVVIPAGSDSGSIVIEPIADGITEGTEVVQLIVPTGICSFMTGEYDTHYVDIIDYTPLLVNTTNDTTINCGDHIDLVAQSSGGISPYDYLWTTYPVNVGYTDSINITPISTKTYTIEVTDACDNSVYDSVEVIVNGITVDAGQDTAICAGDSITLTATGATTYQWSNGSVTPSITVSPAATTTYFVTGTALCTGEDSVTVQVNPLPVINIQASQDSVCAGEFTSLSASGASTWSWSSTPSDNSLLGQETQDTITVSPNQSTTYLVTGTDQYGCESSASHIIVAKPSPTSDFAVLDTLICTGEPTTVVYGGSSSTNAQFFWYFDNGHASGSGSGPYQVQWDSAGQKTITLSVVDMQCPSDETARSVGVQAHPEVGFTASPTEGCPTLTVSFTDTSSNVSQNPQYQWKFGNGGVSYQHDPTFNYTESGWFDVSLTVTNSNGCQSTMIVEDMVHVFPVPVASFTHNPEFGSEFDPLIKFYDRSTGNITSWWWHTGDSTFYDVPDFHHQYADTGTYDVSLVVTNADGCTDTVSYEVLIRPDYTFFVPTAFTPDGDLLNDEFKVFGLNNQAFAMNIYDRWGGLVFESNDINRGWDGTINGKDAPVGIYVVVIYYTDVHGLRHSHYGHVTLLR